jgi:hypothetical protein
VNPVAWSISINSSANGTVGNRSAIRSPCSMMSTGTVSAGRRWRWRWLSVSIETGESGVVRCCSRSSRRRPVSVSMAWSWSGNVAAPAGLGQGFGPLVGPDLRWEEVGGGVGVAA